MGVGILDHEAGHFRGIQFVEVALIILVGEADDELEGVLLAVLGDEVVVGLVIGVGDTDQADEQ